MDENSNATQCKRIIAYMKAHGSITAIDAIVHLGVFRLAARIRNIKDDGHAVSKRMVAVLNRFNEPVRVAEYRFEVRG